MSAESTTIQIYDTITTTLTSATATVNVPASLFLSDDTPAELSNTGSSGASVLASRADHSHPLTGATFNGGNF